MTRLLSPLARTIYHSKLNQATVTKQDPGLLSPLAPVPPLPPPISAYPKRAVIGVQSVQKFHSPDAPVDRVRVYLVNVRVAQTGTDLLLTMNVPPGAQAGEPALTGEVFAQVGRACVNNKK
jgi:hypothetical protein